MRSTARAPSRSAPGSRPDPFLVEKAREVRRIAEAKGLIRKGGKDRMVTARMGGALLDAAKRRTGIASDSELLEIAVASLAVADDFGEWLIAQRGRLPKDFEIDL